MFKTIDTGAGVFGFSRLGKALKAIADNFAMLAPGVTTSAAAAYTLVLGDRYVLRTNAGAQTVTIPPNANVAFDIGTEILVEQNGAGALTIAAGAGVTVHQLAAKTLIAAGQYAVVRLVKIAANTWTISGDLTAA